MYYRAVLLCFIFCSLLWEGLAKRASHKKPAEDDDDLGLGLIASLRDDVNLDLSVDEEYEDLRAELLAYQAALASVISRRSLMTTPCWQVGGICINEKLCKGARHITQVAGCKDKYNVCCFAWNRYFVKDYRDKGIPNLAMPWKSLPQEYGGEIKEITKSKKGKNKRLKNTLIKPKKKLIHHHREDDDDDQMQERKSFGLKSRRGSRN